MCSLDSQISRASKNRAPIHHESAKSLKSGQSLISSPRHGYCDVFFEGKYLESSRFWAIWRRALRYHDDYMLQGHIRSSHWLIPNTAHAQSGDYLRLGRAIECFHSRGRIYANLLEQKIQLSQDWFGTPTWPPLHCFGTPIWAPWRHVKTLYIF